MSDTHIKSTKRRGRLFLFSALAIVLLTLLGKEGDAAELEKTIKSNTSKTHTYSFFRQGGIYYQMLLKVKEENVIKLMKELSYYLSQYRLYKRSFDVI